MNDKQNSEINTNKLIYTDVDNLFMKDINDLFSYYPTKKIILKKKELFVWKLEINKAIK